MLKIACHSQIEIVRFKFTQWVSVEIPMDIEIKHEIDIELNLV